MSRKIPGLPVVLFLMLLAGAAGSAFAECARDRTGAVHCASEPTGGAIRDNSGYVVCGKGQCRRDRSGVVRCSVTSGGGAEVDSYGAVQCLGGCQVGSSAMCSPASQ